MSKKTIGIIGGMGPMATVDLYRKIILNTASDTDNGHIHIIIDNYPQIPDRTAAILEGSDRPLPYLLESAARLKGAGADFLLIPCNTAHYFYDRIVAGAGLPVLNMLTATAQRIKARGAKKAGLLATDGVIESGVYARAFAACGIETVLPTTEQQKVIMNLIYNEVKAGREIHTEPLLAVTERMARDGAECFVLGCTELPLAFEGIADERFIDPTLVLAREAVREAGYELRQAAV